MQAKFYFKISFRIILTCVFVFSCVQGIIKLIKSEVGSRNLTEKKSSNSFPSFAICPYMYSPKVDQVYMEQNMTFDDVMKLPSIRDNVLIDVQVSKPYKEM